MNISKKLVALVLTGLMLSCNQNKKEGDRTLGQLQVSENGRYLTQDGKPFFWLGDTGWLLFNKLTRAEAETYLEDRHRKGFNVVQAMVLHTVPSVNVYGDSSIVAGDVSRPLITQGANPDNDEQYDYWDHVDYVIDVAASKGIYMAVVPVWGTPVKDGQVSTQQAKSYATFLAERWKDKSNIIWLNGGDIKGSDSLQVWQEIAGAIRAVDNNHLMTFHPRGRTASSDWFHEESWLDFNMVQSGHRNYEQDTSSNETNHYGPDNFRYIQVDWNLKPVKPTIDGEPSYEGIPHGLHDVNLPRWTDADVRRYGYWSVFAGAFGYTYGQSSVIQMHVASDTAVAYGSTELWSEAINAPGASQMQYIKDLMLSRENYFDRVPDQSLIAENGERYDRLIATRTDDYAFIYSYTGAPMQINMGKIAGDRVKASWFNPRDGSFTTIGEVKNEGVQRFDPAGETKDGNDWVLVLDTVR